MIHFEPQKYEKNDRCAKYLVKSFAVLGYFRIFAAD